MTGAPDTRPWLYVSGPSYEGRPICREIGSADVSHSVTAPTTLFSMATVAREIGGAQPIVLDLQARRRGLDLLAAAIREHRPSVVVQALAYAVKDHDLEVFRTAREVDPEIRTVCLPIPPAYADELIRDHPEVDVAIHSGDEMPMGPLAQAFASAGRFDPEDLESIAGISFRAEDGTPRRTDPIRFEYPGLYGSLPHPDFSLADVPLSRYDKHVSYWTRGCPSLCTFCTDAATVRTARTASDMADELETLERVHGISYVDFYDRNFLIRLDEVRELCDEIIRRKLRIGWTAFCRINRIDRDLAEKMSAAGCRLLCVGLESANKRVLRDIKKGTNMKRAHESLANVKAAGIRLALYLIFGLPEEDEDSIRETVDFVKQVRPDFCVPSTATPYEGTDLYEVVEGEGLWAERDSEVYSLKLEDVKIRTRHLSAERLAELRDEALLELRRWRLSPSTLWHLARRTNTRELRLLAHPNTLQKAARRIVPYFTRKGF